jgi:hypothetical protein
MQNIRYRVIVGSARILPQAFAQNKDGWLEAGTTV